MSSWRPGTFHHYYNLRPRTIQNINDDEKKGITKERPNSKKKIKLLESKNDDVQAVHSLHPLTMVDIIHTLFLYLDMDGLKTSRRICKLWEELALKRMLKRQPSFRVPEYYYKRSAAEKESDQVLVKTFLTRKNIKVQKVILRKVDDVDVFRSLNILGSQIQELKLNFTNPALLTLLTNEDVPSLMNISHLNSPATDFNIHQISILDQFNGMDQPVLISQLIFVPYDPLTYQNYLSIYQRFSKGQVKVKSIRIFLSSTLEYPAADWSGVSRVLNEILLKSHDVIEEIILGGPCGFLNKLEFPVLKKVKKLVCRVYLFDLDGMVADTYCQGLLFPFNFRFDQNLPNLSHVALHRGLSNLKRNVKLDQSFDVWKKSFENLGPAPEVKTLLYDEEFEMSVNVFSKTFPQAKLVENPQY